MPIVRKAADVALGARQVVKDLGRLQEIVQVLGRHGLGWLVASVEVPGIGLLRRLVPDRSPEAPTPERVRQVFEDLGPTFIKLGQVLSTREDLLPPSYLLAFSKLQDGIGSLPWEPVAGQIEADLGKPIDELFESIDETPIASASIAQVHRATLPSGEDVAVKVQHPGIRAKIQTDLSILEFLARQIDAQFTEARVVDLAAAVAVLRKSTSEETDFRNEAANAELFRRNFEGEDAIIIPRVYGDYSGRDVLTLEFLDGTRISDARQAGHDMQVVGERYLSAAFKMMLEDGDFHSDLHPGNVLVLPGERLGLLDFGMVGRLSDEMKADLIALFYALQRNDFRTIARIYWEMAYTPAYVDYGQWETDVQTLMERHIKGRSMADVSIADFLQDLLRGAAKHQVRTNSAYTMFFKALITTEGLAKMLLPEVDPIESMRPYVERMVRQQYSFERLKQETFYYLTSFRYTTRRLPMLTGQLLSDLQEGRLRLRTVVEHKPEELARQERQANRLTLSIIFCGLMVGASLAVDSSAPRLLGLPAPSTLGYSLAALTLLGLLRAIARSRKL